MSEHAQGRIKAIRWVDGLSALRPEESNGRYFGGAPVIDLIGGSMTEANARRLAAAWNACENMTTEAIEALAGIGSLGDLKASELHAANARIAKLEALVAERDAMLGRRPCQNSRCMELNAARALLREVLEDENKSILHYKVRQRVCSYLDACDTLEGNKPVDAIGCRKCGDILPAGDYCKAPACPLNPSMKGK